MEEFGGVNLTIIGLDGLGHDDGGGVAALDGLGGGGDGTGDVAGTQEEGNQADDQED